MSNRVTAHSLSSQTGVRIIDIRKAPDDEKIPGSEVFDSAGLESGDAIPFTPDERVVLYCGSGNSCSRIAEKLHAQGYDVAALDGGYKAWKEAGLPTEPR